MYKKILDRLANGKSVVIAPAGNSMTPRIRSKQAITIIPVDRVLEVGDVVLAKVKGQYYVHLISAIDGDRVQISNNHGHVNGWTDLTKIYGRVVNV